MFAREGIEVHAGASIGSVAYADGLFSVEADDQTLQADQLLVAAGRRPNLADLGLDTVGLDPHARALDIDEHMRAGEGLWAIGDITGKGAFTHMSMYQAAIAVRDILGQDGPGASYHAVPHVTFTDPEVGVGRDDREAGTRGRAHRPGRYDGPGLVHPRMDREGRGPGQARRGRRPGRAGRRHGGRAVRGEVLSMLVTAVHAEIPTDTLRTMIYAYPTFHRAVEDALSKLA